jgi:hypothetical protein
MSEADRRLYDLYPPNYKSAYLFVRRTLEDDFVTGEKLLVQRSILSSPQVHDCGRTFTSNINLMCHRVSANI